MTLTYQDSEKKLEATNELTVDHSSYTGCVFTTLVFKQPADSHSVTLKIQAKKVTVVSAN